MQNYLNIKLVNCFSITLLIFCFLFISALPCQSQQTSHTQNHVQLTPAEQNWLKEHPIIHLGIADSWPPLAIYHKYAPIKGFDPDMIQRINQLTGTNIQIVSGKWDDIVKQAENHQLDGLMESSMVESRRKHFNFSDIYASHYYVLATTKENKKIIGHPSTMKGKRLAYLKGNVWVEKIVNSIIGVNPIQVTSEVEGFQLVIDGKADAAMVALFQVTEYRKLFKEKLEIVHVFKDIKLDVVYSIRKDWPELVSIINKGLAAISEEERFKIYTKWIVLPESETRIPLKLTKSEEAWLAKKHVVKVRMTNYPPFVMQKADGTPEGIAVDLLLEAKERAGFEIEFIQSSATFPEALENLKDHKNIDLIISLTQTKKREKSISFTQPYFRSPYVIIVHKDEQSIVTGINDLTEKRIAIPKNYEVHNWFKENHSNLKLLLYDDDTNALEAVATRKADAYIGNLPTIKYLILQRGLMDLKVAAPCSIGDQVSTMGIRNDWPELASIIDKAMATIPTHKQAKIRDKYLILQYEYGIKKSDILYWVGLSLLLISFIVFAFIIWNRSLATKVQERTIELKTANEQLQQSRDFLRQITNSMEDVIFTTKEPERIIEWYNDSFGIFGYELNEVLGKKTSLFYSTQEEFQRIWQLFELASKENKNTFQTETWFKRKNGEVFPGEIKATILRKAGIVVRVTGVVRDISDAVALREYKKNMEARAIQSQKMESLGVLAGGIAHDFNNILAIIIGYADIGLLEVEKDSLLEECVQKISTAGLRAKDLIKQILTFARRSDNKLCPVQLHKCIEDVVNLLRGSLPSSIEITCSIHSKLCILAEPSQVNQIVMNLCTNAAHAMEENGGRLAITLDEITSQEAQELSLTNQTKSYLKLVICDNGQGISEENLSSIFDPYFTTKQQDKGIGLGLSVVHGIVTSFAGEIRVESQLNKGTTFYVYLPVTTLNKNNEPIEVEELPTGDEHILLVDDEIENVKINELILSRLGYKITAYTNSVDALEFFKNNPNSCDLLLTDLTMPNLTGDQLIKEIRAIRSNMKIILCTGFNKIYSESTCETNRPNTILFKPVRKNQLAQTIREILDQDEPHALPS